MTSMLTVHTLKKRIKWQGRFNETKASRVIKQVLEDVAIMHGYDIAGKYKITAADIYINQRRTVSNIQLLVK